ncbi:uncharacterized protein LOC126887324 isoform X2 [Diabrotica virgifera virgifera]|uniref:Uncharacterized protein n=1 Tax=Diabrotica virgifera virgifera TaxID=50390 RepID=A0ABM5KKK2_DIAVI|nr:uncharacterized protein LOC126887324 isoform X2 [Diabrotica virgifera virgifera]
MECNENKDSTNQEILTHIKGEGDSLQKYNSKEVKSEPDNSSYGQESVLDEYCSNSEDVKIENHVLEDVSNEIKVKIKNEPEECSNGGLQDITVKVTKPSSAPKVHLKTGTGETSHKCEIYSKLFTTKGGPRDITVKVTKPSSAAKVHLKTCTVEKPYICEICSKLFTLKVVDGEDFDLKY